MKTLVDRAIDRGFIFVRTLVNTGIDTRDFYRAMGGKGYQCYPTTRLRHKTDQAAIEIEKTKEIFYDENNNKLMPCMQIITKCYHYRDCQSYHNEKCEVGERMSNEQHS
jgi:hypothetical protein